MLFGTGSLDGLIDLPRSELVRPLFARFLVDDPEHFRLRRGKTHVIPNAEWHGLGRAAFLNDEGAALVLYPAQELAERVKPRADVRKERKGGRGGY